MATNLLLTVCLVAVVATVRSDYLGRLCGTQWGHDHFYPSSGSQVQECINHCHKDNYLFAGLLHGTDCFCDNSTAPFSICRNYSTESICQSGGNCSWATAQPCKNDPTMTCGDETWYSLYDAGDKWNIVWHWDTNVNDICSRQSNNCSWSCQLSDQNYTYAHGSIYGTIQYDIGSSYCLAAAHDLRYVANQDVAVSILRKQYTQASEVQGSWKYGIASSWVSTEHYFIFTAPSRNFDFSDSVLWAFVNLMGRTLDCRNYYSGGGSVKPFVATLAGEVQPSATNVALPENTIFYCGVTEGINRAPATYIPVVTQPLGNAKAVRSRTIVEEAGKDVNIYYNTAGLSGSPFTIEKQDHEISTTKSGDNITVNLPSVKEEDAGFYRLTAKNGSIAARTRLIVVPENTKLDICGGFRGVPREDKTCLCFPPFGNAADCTGVCNRNTLDGTFGPNCDMNCGSQNCKGFLVCGEDPFGCHCSSGWTGDTCNTPCATGRWGPDCELTASGCHCADGDGCNRVTGDCPFGCEWGYFGDSCRNKGPYIITAPTITYTAFTYMTVCWNKWVNQTDPGDVGPPDGYYLEYTNTDVYGNATGMFPAGPTRYCYNVTGLSSYVKYYYRIRTSYNGEIMPWPSNSTSDTIACQTPTAPVKSLSGLGIEGNKINVAWVWPDKDTWNCDETKLHCDYKCSYECETETLSGTFEVNDTTITSYAVQVNPYSTCAFECYVTNGPNMDGPGSNITDIDTKVSPAGKVLNFNGFSTDKGLVLVWATPSYEDGHIFKYQIDIESHGLSFNTDMHRFTFTEAQNGDTYLISIVAYNSLGAGDKLTTKVKYYIPA